MIQFRFSFPNLHSLLSFPSLDHFVFLCPPICALHILYLPPNPQCPLFNLPPHQYRGDNKSPVSQRVCHIVILVSVGLRQVHPFVRVPHSNLKRQTELEIDWTTFPALISVTFDWWCWLFEDINCSVWTLASIEALSKAEVVSLMITDTHRCSRKEANWLFLLSLTPSIQTAI